MAIASGHPLRARCRGGPVGSGRTDRNLPNRSGKGRTIWCAMLPPRGMDGIRRAAGGRSHARLALLSLRMKPAIYGPIEWLG
jgi:hypothetical protein